jgi:hypothetical protein
MEMYEENDFDEEREAERRKASVGGLLAGMFLLFLVGAVVVALLTFWPVVKNAPVSPPSSVPQAAE